MVPYKKEAVGRYQVAFYYYGSSTMFTAEQLDQIFAESGCQMIISCYVERTNFNSWSSRRAYQRSGISKLHCGYVIMKRREFLDRCVDTKGRKLSVYERGKYFYAHCIDMINGDIHNMVSDTSLGFALRVVKGTENNWIMRDPLYAKFAALAYLSLAKGAPYDGNPCIVHVKGAKVHEAAAHDERFTLVREGENGFKVYSLALDFEAAKDAIRSLNIWKKYKP